MLPPPTLQRWCMGGGNYLTNALMLEFTALSAIRRYTAKVHGTKMFTLNQNIAPTVGPKWRTSYENAAILEN